jgi:hypothetical protein
MGMALGNAVAPTFFDKLMGGGMGGFFSGLGNAVTGLPVMQAFGQEASPMGSFGQLLGGGLLGGDFSNAGQAYMLGGGMGGGMNPQMSPVGMSAITQADIERVPNAQISNAEAQRMMAEMMQQQQMPNQNMMMPLDTMTDPRVLMGGLLGDLSPSMRNRQIGI